MLKILVPVDGSENASHAVDSLIARIPRWKDPVEVHLLNVQHPLTGDIGRFLDHEQIREFHRDEGLKALDPARRKLQAAGVDHVFHIGVGDPAEVIDRYAREIGCDEIVMATHGRGSIAALFLGSVAAKVVQMADVPVVLVK